MAIDDLTWMPGWQIRDRILDGTVSAVQVTEHFLARTQALDPVLNAYRTLDAAGARAQARAADEAQARGEVPGPLHGIPVSVKEHIPIEGLPYLSTASLVSIDRASRDAILVERLRKAGAIIFGASIMPGMGIDPNTPDLAKHPRNPWDITRIPGTSTAGGAASVAAGLLPVTIGSDGAGSSRLPAAHSGIIGFHPSVGRVPWVDYDYPGIIQQNSYGPLTRDVRDSAIIMQVIGGPDGRDYFALQDAAPDYVSGLDKGADGLRFAWTDDFGFGKLYAQPETPAVIAAIRAAAFKFAEIGAHVEVTGEQWEDYWPNHIAATAAYGNHIAVLAYKAETTPAKLQAAHESHARNWGRFQTVFAANDLMLSPTIQFTAPTVESWAKSWGDQSDALHGVFMPTFAADTNIFNIMGWPAISVPCGFVDGRPVGLQIIGKPDREALILRAAAAFMKAFPRSERPDLSQWL